MRDIRGGDITERGQVLFDMRVNVIRVTTDNEGLFRRQYIDGHILRDHQVSQYNWDN